jgi:hypothetical protein
MDSSAISYDHKNGCKKSGMVSVVFLIMHKFPTDRSIFKGNLDVSSNSYKIVTNGSASISLESSNNVTAVDCLKSVNPDAILDTSGKSDNLNVGLIQFRIRVNNPGDSAQVRIYYSSCFYYPANYYFSFDHKFFYNSGHLFS